MYILYHLYHLVSYHGCYITLYIKISCQNVTLSSVFISQAYRKENFNLLAENPLYGGILTFINWSWIYPSHFFYCSNKHKHSKNSFCDDLWVNKHLQQINIYGHLGIVLHTTNVNKTFLIAHLQKKKFTEKR